MKSLKKLFILLFALSLLISCSSTASVADEEVPATEIEIFEDTKEKEALISPDTSLVNGEEKEDEDGEEAPVLKENSVISIDEESRALTNLDLASFESFGYGDVFAVQAGESFFYAPLVPSDASVRGGEWYMTIEDGAIILARKGEKAELEIGDEIHYTLNSKGGYADAITLSALYPVNTKLVELNTYAAGALRANTLYTIYLPMLTMNNLEALVDLVIEANITTVVDLSGKIDPYQAEAYSDLVNFYTATELSDALKIVMSTSKPYLLILDESISSIMIAPILESVMGARLEDILIDCITPYSNYYGVKPDDSAYEVMSNMIVNYFTELNDGEAPVNKSLLSLSVNYLRYKLGFSIDEVSALRASLR